MKITEPYSPTARAKASAKPVSRRDHRQDYASQCLQAVRPERGRDLLKLDIEIDQHRLHRAHHEGQADEDKRHQYAERRE